MIYNIMMVGDALALNGWQVISNHHVDSTLKTRTPGIHDHIMSQKHFQHYWPLCEGKPLVKGRFPSWMTSKAELWCFSVLSAEQAVEQTAGLPKIWDAMSLWCMPLLICIVLFSLNKPLSRESGRLETHQFSVWWWVYTIIAITCNALVQQQFPVDMHDWTQMQSNSVMLDLFDGINTTRMLHISTGPWHCTYWQMTFPNNKLNGHDGLNQWNNVTLFLIRSGDCA